MGTQRLDALGWLFLLLGAAMLGNALWMLAGPMHWYTELPAAVPDTGPFNAHFVRDIGCALRYPMARAGIPIRYAGSGRIRPLPAMC